VSGGGFTPGSGFLNIGLRMMTDTYANFWAPGLATYLRYQNSASQSAASELGFQIDLTGPSASGNGFTDLQILPQPTVEEVSKHNIGVSGGLLMFGAKTFLVSATFVNNIMEQRGYTDPYQVWRDPLVMGIFYNQRLYSIQSIQESDVGGQPYTWNLTCNMVEEPPSPSLPGEIPIPDLGG
jgi:hypothetical protein